MRRQEILANEETKLVKDISEREMNIWKLVIRKGEKPQAGEKSQARKLTTFLPEVRNCGHECRAGPITSRGTRANEELMSQ